MEVPNSWIHNGKSIYKWMRTGGTSMTSETSKRGHQFVCNLPHPLKPHRHLAATKRYALKG